MTQDERWSIRYNDVVDFINAHKRNPSKYVDEERNIVTFCKHCRKQMNAGLLKPERVERFKELMALMGQYKRKNQYE